MPRRILKLLSVAILISTAYLFGQVPVSKSPPVQDLTLMGFTLGRSTLTEVESKLGVSQTRKCSQEEESAKAICYVSADGRTRVVFEAGFSGGWQRIDGFKIIAGVVKLSCYRQCTPVNLPEYKFRTDGGLHLGMTSQEIQKLLGKPTRTTLTMLTFQWHSRQPADKTPGQRSINNDYWDVQDTIDIVFVKSKATEIKVEHLVTN